MAFRNQNAPSGTGYGMLPYQQMYMPGNMNLGQQQQPRPGISQFVQTRPSFHAVPPQRYPIMQQGMPPQQGSFQPQMFGGQVPPQGVAMQQQAAFHHQQQQAFPVHPQQQQVPAHMQPQHQRQQTEQQKRAEEQAKKERYFQEQQRKLKQFGRVSGKAASVDSLGINLDEMFGKGLKKETTGNGDKMRDKTQEQKGEEVEDDGFGDFLQAPCTPANTPQTPDSAPLTPSGQQPAVGSSHSSPNDEGFGEFLGGPTGGSMEEKKDVKPVENAKSKSTAEGKKVLSLESMMLDSADLTAPSKSSASFHHKKPLNKMDSSNQAHRQQTFASNTKAKSWSSAEHVTSLFVKAEPPNQIGTGQTDHGQGMKPGSTIVAAGGGNGKGLPAWCMDEANLPLVYRQVLEASIRDNRIETNLLYPILILSGLDKTVLGRIWTLANQTILGQLTRPELYAVLGLIALTQNGQQPTIEALHQFREAPVPILKHKGQSRPQTSHQSLPQPSNRPPAASTGIVEDDDFAPFQDASGNKTNTSSTHGHAFGVGSDKHKHSDDKNGREEFHMDSSLKFPKEEENCYIFAGSPGDSSSGRSSPLVWDPNSIYDKLTCRSPGSVSSGSLSDRTPNEEEEDDEFHDFKSAPKPSKTSNSSPLASFPSIAPPKSNSSVVLSSLTSASAKQVKFASSGMRSLDSLKKGPSQPGDDPQIDLFQMDFEKVFPKVGRKPVSADDFGTFQSGPGSSGSSTTRKEDDDFGDFSQFKHSASESDLMGMQPAEADKYAVLRDMVSENPQTLDIQESADDDFDDFKQAQPSQDTAVPAAIKPSKSLPDFKNTIQQTPGFVANFDDAYPSMPPPAPSSIFEPSPVLPQINLSPILTEEDDFATFKRAQPSANASFPSLKSDSASTSSSEDKYSIIRVLGGADDREQPDDDFGDFQTNPPVMDSLSLSSFTGKHGEETNLGEMKKPMSASDLYGMDFDTLGSVNSGSITMLNLEDNIENEPSDELENTPTDPPLSTHNNFYSSHNSKLSKLESIDRLDLKTFDLDLTLGRSAETENKDRGDSFGVFSSAPTDVITPPVDGSSSVMSNDTLSPSAMMPHYGVSTVPLVPSGSSLIGDRYAEVVGNIDDENRHGKEWQRCLEKCHEAVKKANNVFNNISSSAVCNEVIKSSEGAEYLTAVIEIYRVACRIVTSMNALGVDTEDLQRLQKDIELVWTNLSAFLASSSLMPAAGSFVFKTAVLRPEPTNTERACGVCLLNVDSRSKAFDRSKDSHKLVYGGRQYHATCANLWVNMVDSILPSLPLNRLL